MRSFLLILVLMCLVLTACDSGGDSKKEQGSLAGAVVVFDAADNSGVTVSAYPAVDIPAAITSAQDASASLGVSLNQSTCFDHRLAGTPAATAITSSTGAYTLSGLDAGLYNLVFYKDGYGFLYQCGLQVQGGTSQVPAQQLKPEVELPWNIGTMTLEAGVNYVVTTNSQVQQGAVVTMQGGSIVRVQPGCALNLFSNAVFPTGNGLCWITVDDGLTANRSMTQRFSGVKFYSESTSGGQEVHNLRISQADTGVTVEFNNMTLTHTVVQNCINSVAKGNSSSASITNMVLAGCVFSGTSGNLLELDNLNTLTLDHCVLYNAKADSRADFAMGAWLYDINTSGTVSDCLFYNNDVGLGCLRAKLTVTHNYFLNNNYGMTVSDASPVVSYNNFADRQTCLEICVVSYNSNTRIYSLPVANYNNFYVDHPTWAVDSFGSHQLQTSGIYSGPGLKQMMDGTHNYWQDAPAAVIRDSLDKDNYPDPNNFFRWHTVDYSPKLTRAEATAGIR